MLVDVHMTVLPLLLQHKVLLLPLVCLVLLFGEEALHFDPLLLLGIRLFAAFAQRGVDLLRGGFLGFLLQGGKGSVVFTALFLDVLAEGVSLHNLFRLVARYDRVQTLESPVSPKKIYLAKKTIQKSTGLSSTCNCISGIFEHGSAPHPVT